MEKRAALYGVRGVKCRLSSRRPPARMAHCPLTFRLCRLCVHIDGALRLLDACYCAMRAAVWYVWMLASCWYMRRRRRAICSRVTKECKYFQTFVARRVVIGARARNKRHPFTARIIDARCHFCLIWFVRCFCTVLFTERDNLYE